MKKIVGKAIIILGLLVVVGSLIVFRNARPGKLEIGTVNAPVAMPAGVPGIGATNRIESSGGKTLSVVSGGHTDEENVSKGLIPRLPLSKIPGGSLVDARAGIMDAIVGAEGLGEIVADENLSDDMRAERLARVALNAGEEPEVRQEALDQWLKLLPEESEALLVALAKNRSLSPAMGAILLKDTLTRGEVVQAEVAYTLLGQENNELRQLAAEQLALLTGKNHGFDLSAWLNEIRIFIGARQMTP